MSLLPDLLLKSLDASEARLPIFFRDDDAGWAHDALRRLLSLFESHYIPLDLAVIPAAVDDDIAADLRRHADRNDLLGLHQHGYAHVNHETEGRKCEFGGSRARQQQRTDIERGRDFLHSTFGLRIDKIFTPPWNRCSVTTREVLRDLGFSAISQIVDDGKGITDDRHAAVGLVELPVTFDWHKPRAPRGERAEGSPIGVMLHHAAMSDADFEQLDLLLTSVGRHGSALPCRMRDLVVLPC